MKPLVSIITPSYNQGRFIRETIESVLSQNYENIEYIVVDGGSTDDSLEIIKEYEGRLTFISEKDNGQSDAINKGFRMAHGDIVAWLNSDDLYEPDCIAKAVEEFVKKPQLGLLYGDGYIIDKDGFKLRVFENTQEFDYWKLVNFWDYIMQPATFFKRETLEKVGYLDENLHYCMDWDLWIKLAAVSEVKYIPQLLACSREHGETKTSTGGDRRLEEIINLLQKYSGKESPLGVQSYKASTFYTKYADSIWPVRKLVGLYLVCKHRWLERQVPTKHADGWIGRSYAVLVPGYVKKVTVVVENLLQNLLPQTITVFVNGIEVRTCEIMQCAMKEIVLTFDGKKIANEVVLKCSKIGRIGKGDYRKCSVRILDVRYE